MSTYAILVDGKNTGKRMDTGNGVTAANLKTAAADAYAGGDKKRIQLFRLI